MHRFNVLMCTVWIFSILLPLIRCNPGLYLSKRPTALNNRRSETRNVEENLDDANAVVGENTCNTEQIQYRLTRLEVQVAEKAENLRSELREGNRRLQALEWQSAETQSALEGFKAELGRFAEQTPAGAGTKNPVETGNDKLERHIENLSKGVQLLVAAVRGLNSDIGLIKNNMTALTNLTTSLIQENKQLLTKQFFNSEMIDLKHHQLRNYDTTSTKRCSNTSEIFPKNCKEVLESGSHESGIYRIKPEHSSQPFMVLCDMTVEDGGWTYIHNRYEGAQDFYLNWHDYKRGFGNLGGEFWLGLDFIHQLTSDDVNELLVELVDANREKRYARYGAFSIGSESEGFALKVLGGYEGDAGDSLIYHAGSKFSTKDMDQDAWAEGNCAQAHTGAWWYRGCDTSNLNGRYLNGDLPEDYMYQGMYWADFKGAQHSLLQARMLVRPRSSSSFPMIPKASNH